MLSNQRCRQIKFAWNGIVGLGAEEAYVEYFVWSGIGLWIVPRDVTTLEQSLAHPSCQLCRTHMCALYKGGTTTTLIVIISLSSPSAPLSRF